MAGSPTFFNDGSVPMRTDPQWKVLQKILGAIVDGGGGGGGGPAQVFNGHYGGVTPGIVPFPGTSAALAYDLDAPYQIWHWNPGTLVWE